MTDGLEQRKEELFATITLIGAVKRQIVELRDTDTTPLYDRLALLEADKERLSHEVNSEYMYRNLQAFMNRVDAYDAARQKGEKETHSGIAALSGLFQSLAEAVTQLETGQERLVGEVADLAERMSASETDRKDMRDRLARLEAVNERLTRIEAAMAERNGDAK